MESNLENMLIEFGKGSEKQIIEFLEDYQKKIENFLNGNMTDIEMSDYAIRKFVTEEKFSDELGKYDKNILKLKRDMDVSHPDWTIEKKEEWAKDSLEICKKLLKKHNF